MVKNIKGEIRFTQTPSMMRSSHQLARSNESDSSPAPGIGNTQGDSRNIAHHPRSSNQESNHPLSTISPSCHARRNLIHNFPHTRPHPSTTTTRTTSPVEKLAMSDIALVEPSCPCMCYTAPDCVQTTNTEPPITKSSLAELDLNKIIENIKLRHDLNFEREIAFRPNYYGWKGELKKALAKAYWHDLTQELAFYIKRLPQAYPTPANLSPDSWPHSSFLPRLPQMFRTIGEILKSLVPEVEWPSVDEVLDVDLLLQQLENGVCDLIGLSNWLGKLLMGSCSPCRDSQVINMVTSIQEAVSSHDAQGLVVGIEQLFGILETMKLDVANHQIRELKLLLIDDSIKFEQGCFLKQPQSRLHMEVAQIWYTSEIHQNMLAEVDTYKDVFVRAVIGIVTGRNPEHSYPTTFMHDIERLQKLKTDIQRCLYQNIYGETFRRTLNHLGHTASPPLRSYQKLLDRISKIDQPTWAERSEPSQLDNIVLEILRTAYSVCNLNAIPSDQHVAITKQYLMDAESDDNLRWSLDDQLEDIVLSELENISPLTPLQIQNHYYPNPIFPQTETPSDDLQNIGERLAHIIELHWRTWAPIVYLPPLVHNIRPQLQRAAQANMIQRKSYSAPNLPMWYEDTPRS